MDGTGNLYVAGETGGSFDGQTNANAGSRDLCVTKWNPDGTKLWTRIWGSGANDYACPASVDVSGNLYIAGSTLGSFDGQTNASTGFYDLCVTKWRDPLPLTVANLAATNITVNSATLQGDLVSQGDGTATVARIYWGASDGGTNEGSWSNVVDMGVQPVGAFSTNVTGLATNTLYYYRCFATNSSGIAWATPSATNFTTLAAVPPAAPTNLAVNTVSSNQLALAWTDLSTNETGFIIERKAADDWRWLAVTQVVQNVTNYTDSGLQAGTWHYYRVNSYNAGGNSVPTQTQGAPTSGNGLYLKSSWPGFQRGDAYGVYVSGNYAFVADGGAGLKVIEIRLAPGIHNSAATDITTVSATLNGNLTSTSGDSNTTVRIHWGPSDGGTNVTAWSNVVNMGVLPVGAFSTNTYQLTPNTLYFYRCFASNVSGIAWASETTNFTTLPETNSLVVASGYGTPTPSGTNWFVKGTLVISSVAGSPFTLGTTQYVCTGWSGAGVSPASGSGTNVSFNITNNSTLVWRWTTNYWLAVGVVGSGTCENSVGWLPAGTNVTITATASAGYRFANWTGDVSSANNPLTLTMGRPYSVTANFAMNTGSVTVTIGPAEIVARGAQWRMTAGPDTNWHGNGYVIGNVPGSGALYTIAFTNVMGWSGPGDITTVDIANNATTTLTAAYSIGDMALIPGGTFQMEIQDGAGGHTVTLDSFYMDRKEVTMGQYQAFCAATGRQMPTNLPPWWTWGDTNLPMVFVAWHEAASYAAWIGKRLPTEAEFEYAMRSGFADRRYPWGDTISSNDANYNLNVGGRAPAGRYPATAYAIFDIAGNVAEWCNDWHTNVLTGPVTNPVGPASGEYKVIRGGAWPNWQNNLTCAFRSYAERYATYSSVGFRCVRTHEDLDLNNIPDLWERSYFGGTCDPQADPDNDGLKNWQEYVADTDPTNRLSALRIKSIVPLGDGIRIEWAGGAQATQFVQRCSRFATGAGYWQSILTNMPPMPATSNFTDTRATNTSIFYRIKAAR